MSDITRAEAISELLEMKLDAWTDTRQMKALDMAINSLKVDEMYDLAMENPDAVIDRKVIEDIKAEIEFERDRKLGGEFFEAVQYKSFNKCLEIIDKHIGW